MTLFTIAFTLFLIMDPIGNVTPFLNMTEDFSSKKRRWIVIREMGIALGFMLFFTFLGEYLFNILNISEVALKISSGLILFLIALQILIPHFDSMRESLPKGEPFFTPLAVPLIAGPSLLTTIMLFTHLEPSVSLMLFSIALAWGAATAVLFFSEKLQRILGINGLQVCENLMGMILILLAIQRFMDGVGQLLTSG